MTEMTDFFQQSFVFKKSYIGYLSAILLLIINLGYADVNQEVKQARCHWLYRVIPRHRRQIPWWNFPAWTLWAVWGNDDDGLFGEEPTARFCPEQQPSIGKACRWAWRNPLHNFSFYVIGSAQRINSELTLLRLTPNYKEAFVYRRKSTTVFPSKHSCFYLALHGGKPFLSYRIVWTPYHESRFYIGWRCRGNFGIRWNPWAKRKNKQQKSCPSLQIDSML